jgi:hypothetical protein
MWLLLAAMLAVGTDDACAAAGIAKAAIPAIAAAILSEIRWRITGLLRVVMIWPLNGLRLVSRWDPIEIPSSLSRSSA